MAFFALPEEDAPSVDEAAMAAIEAEAEAAEPQAAPVTAAVPAAPERGAKSVQADVAPQAVLREEGPGAGGRPDLLNALASMGPIFRAAAVFPGPDADQELTLAVIKMLSRDAVGLANIIARETDELEVDLRWRRTRASAMTAELVASHFISTILSQQGVVSLDMWPASALPRLASALDAAVAQLRETPLVESDTGSVAAGVFALAPLILDLQRFADVVTAYVPGFEVDPDTAAALIGVALAEEVEESIGRLEPLLPGVRRIDLGCELLAQAGPIAQAAWEASRGELLEKLKDVQTDQEAQALLSSDDLTKGFPVRDVCARLRPMIRRLVGASVYSAKMIGARK
ncbi:hypothetical protein ACW0US_17780 [Xanthomonas euvesicatoria]